MARPPLATIDDLTTALGAAPADTGVATSLLERASAIVRAFCGLTWLDEDETEPVDVPPDVPGVVVGMVERATQNPAGLTQETAGPFGRSWSTDAAQRLYLSSMDKLVLRAASGVSPLGVVTITRGPLETPPVNDWWGLPEEVIW